MAARHSAISIAHAFQELCTLSSALTSHLIPLEQADDRAPPHPPRRPWSDAVISVSGSAISSPVVRPIVHRRLCSYIMKTRWHGALPLSVMANQVCWIAAFHHSAAAAEQISGRPIIESENVSKRRYNGTSYMCGHGRVDDLCRWTRLTPNWLSVSDWKWVCQRS